MKNYSELKEILQAKAHYGFTHAGSAIVDVRWFTQGYKMQEPYHLLAATLIFNIEEKYKCYLGNALGLNESKQIQYVAAHGAKLPVEVAIALFPKQFKAEEFKQPTAKSAWDSALLDTLQNTRHQVTFGRA